MMWMTSQNEMEALCFARSLCEVRSLAVEVQLVLVPTPKYPNWNACLIEPLIW